MNPRSTMRAKNQFVFELSINFKQFIFQDEQPAVCFIYILMLAASEKEGKCGFTEATSVSYQWGSYNTCSSVQMATLNRRALKDQAQPVSSARHCY